MKKTKNQTTHKKDNKLIYIQILLGAILAILILLLILNVTGSKTEEKTNLKEKIDAENNIYFLGNKDAPLTITEYSSFTCHFCKRYQIDDTTFENIKTDYIETGKVKYIYKHFTRNNTDIKAANAVECAGEQNKFFEYKKKLYENQANLAKE